MASSAHQQSGKESKRQKYGQNPSGATTERHEGGVYPFHPEDEEIQKVCSTSIYGSFDDGFTCFLVRHSQSYFSVHECAATRCGVFWIRYSWSSDVCASRSIYRADESTWGSVSPIDQSMRHYFPV